VKAHHIGYAVEDMAGAIAAFEALGYSIVKDEFLDEGRKVRIVLLENGPLLLEVIAPAAEGSPVDSILEKAGPSCYHICYVSDDLEHDIAELRTHRFRVILDAEPAPALGRAQVAFLFQKKIGLIELVQELTN
jgi:hypothetical protein